jgi:ribonuclease P protein component
VLWQQNLHQAPRIGFAIAKKRIANAVARNRLRRIARESFRQNLRQLAGVDIVVLAQVAAAEATNTELFRSLANHWRKIAAATSQPHSKINANKSTQGTNLDG